MVKVKSEQKIAVWLAMHDALVDAELPSLPLTITITRTGPRRLDDDNLAGACKYVRDQIAARVGVDDGDSRYTWHYQQRIDTEYGVDVEIIPRQ